MFTIIICWIMFVIVNIIAIFFSKKIINYVGYYHLIYCYVYLYSYMSISIFLLSLIVINGGL